MNRFTARVSAKATALLIHNDDFEQIRKAVECIDYPKKSGGGVTTSVE
jgi:hypothetical protein